MKLRILPENIYKDWWGQQSAKEASNYVPYNLPGYGEFENLCFVFVALTVSVSHVFVYNAVDVNKIATAFLAKPPP